MLSAPRGGRRRQLVRRGKTVPRKKSQFQVPREGLVSGSSSSQVPTPGLVGCPGECCHREGQARGPGGRDRCSVRGPLCLRWSRPRSVGIACRPKAALPVLVGSVLLEPSPLFHLSLVRGHLRAVRAELRVCEPGRVARGSPSTYRLAWRRRSLPAVPQAPTLGEALVTFSPDVRVG